jgi:hypothetical protein
LMHCQIKQLTKLIDRWDLFIKWLIDLIDLMNWLSELLSWLTSRLIDYLIDY